MARIRTIKPEFFRHHDLYALEIDANKGHKVYLNLRIAFAGLITTADREGRFKWRPTELKLDCLPYDQIDFALVLDHLRSKGNPPFIVKYEVGGRSFGLIPGFIDHQRPHHAEAQSKIQPPPPEFAIDRQLAVNRPSIDARKGREGKGREGKGTDMVVSPPTKPKEEKETTPLQRVVNAYKEAKGVGMEDKGWDKANYSRYTKAAKSLIECLSGWEPAAVYVIGKGQEFDDKNLSWTLETIKKHAWDDRGKLNASVQSKMDTDTVLEPRGANRASRRGKQIVKAGEIVARGVLDDIRPDGGEVLD